MKKTESTRQTADYSQSRRGFLHRATLAGTGLVGATGMAGVARANGPRNRSGGKTGLDPRPIEFSLYWSGVDESTDAPDEPAHFGYPVDSDETGGLLGHFVDPEGTQFFDVTELLVTPNGQTMHNTLIFFQGMLLDGKPKPYVLTNRGDGLFRSNGEVANIETKPKEEVEDALETVVKEQEPEFSDIETQFAPLLELAGKSMRAAGVDLVKTDVDENGNRYPEWGVTRVDFYDRSDGGLEYLQSLVYSIWNAEDSGEVGPTPPEPVDEETVALIEEGRLNPGAQ